MRDFLRLLRVRLRSRGRVRASRSVRVCAGARVFAAPGASVVLHPGVVLGPESRVEAVGGTLVIGRDVRVGERAVLVAHSSLEVGAGAVIGDWAAVSDGPPGFTDAARPAAHLAIRPVMVGAGVVVGAHAALSSSVLAGEVVAPYAVR